MSRMLDDASLGWRSGPSLPGWQGLSRALQHHGQCLGLRALDGLAEGAALQLAHPDLHPVHMRFVAPPGLPLESTSEFIQQAACGLMSVHGRASGRPQALGVDYLAALNAALAWQASLAAAVGQLRGGQFTQVSLDPLRGGLLSIGQYLAGATAPEDAERLLPGQDDALARPPFVSLEGTAFELETLDSQPWRHFWHALGLPDSLAGIAQFFKQTEPQSPVPYLIERAIKWGNMPLEGWLSDVIKDSNVVDNIRDVLGTREPRS